MYGKQSGNISRLKTDPDLFLSTIQFTQESKFEADFTGRACSTLQSRLSELK